MYVCVELRQRARLVFAGAAATGAAAACRSAAAAAVRTRHCRFVLLQVAPMVAVVRLVQLLYGAGQRMGERLVLGHRTLHGGRMVRRLVRPITAGRRVTVCQGNAET